jgi:hypothetical protein
MLEPDKVMVQPVDDAHISRSTSGSSTYFLLQGGVAIRRVGTNALLFRKQGWLQRKLEDLHRPADRATISAGAAFRTSA